MKLQSLLNRKLSDGLWVYEDSGDDILVKNVSTGQRFRINRKCAADPKAVERIIDGKRDPTVLKHMTRIIGYYSNIGNWNKSKLGELKDRHKGDYGIGENSDALRKGK